MKPVAIVGSDPSDVSTLTERLTARLGERGRVATVARRTHPTDGGLTHRSAASAAYVLDEDGWSATGESRTLDETLDELAPTYDYVVVDGFSSTRLPTVVVGETDHAGPELTTVTDVTELDLDALCAAIDDCTPHVTLESLVREAKASPRADRAGAIATFTGRVRERDAEDDAATEYLEFETYEGVANDRMAAISADLESREGVLEVLMHHRTGVLATGEDIVFVVVLAGHRTEAFRTVSDGIDRLKDEVPIFKKEVTADEEFWVHERA